MRKYHRASLAWKGEFEKKSSGIAYFVIERSAVALVVDPCVVAEAELLAALGSGSVAVTLAVLTMVPAVAGAVALIVIVALAPDASEATLQVTVLPAMVQVPWVEVAEVEVCPAGRVSVTVTPVAGSGPLLVAPRV